MGILNAYFDQNKRGNPMLNSSGAGAINTGLNLANPFLQTGQRNDDVWGGGGTVGATGASSFMNSAGQMAGQFGAVGVGIQGGLQAVGAMTDLFSYDPEVDAIKTRYSSDQLPSFDLSDEAASTRNFMKDFRQSANKKVGQSTLGGAALGTAIAPGIGTAVGAVAGFVGGLIGKNKADTEANRAAQEMQSKYSQAIGRFNTSTAGFYGKENAMERYRANQQTQSNLFNVPNANPYFYLG